MSWVAIGAGVLGAAVGGGLAAKGAKDAAEAGAEGQAAAARIIAEQADEARRMIFQLVPIGEQNLQTGAQAALNVLGQSIGPQAQMARGGNIAAQQTLIGGMPQFENAIMGRDIDYSQFQPYQGAELPAIDYQLPEFQSAITPEMTAQGEEEAAQADQIDQTVIGLYQEIHGRDPDPSGMAFYRDMITTEGGLAGPGKINKARRHMMSGSEYQNRSV